MARVSCPLALNLGLHLCVMFLLVGHLTQAYSFSDPQPLMAHKIYGLPGSSVAGLLEAVAGLE